MASSAANHGVLTISPTDTAREAAWRMREGSVGFLVVTEHDQPVGVVTDRDVALGVLVEDRDPGECPVSELMTSPVVTLRDDQPPVEASALMRRHGIRKLPVVDAAGRLVGVLTADDLILSLGRQVHDLAEAVRRELGNEAMPPEPFRSVFGKE